MCWDYTRAGTTAIAQCPHDFKPGFSPDSVALKRCNEDGTWYRHPDTNVTWTDYMQCPNNDVDQGAPGSCAMPGFICVSLTTTGITSIPHLVSQAAMKTARFKGYEEAENQMILYISISGYSISCVLLIISIVIFNVFRQLRCTRVLLHQHLFVSFIVTGVMWVATYSLFMDRPDVRKDNPAWCKVVHIITQYASVSNYFWMFCEGFFLHTIVVHAFSKQKKLFFACCMIGWGLPILPVTAYVIARALDAANDIMCWFHPTWTLWFLSAPIVSSLVINFLLLLNILRILLSKIRAFNSAEHNQNRRALKATLILVPLLGLQNMLTLVKPQLSKQGSFAWDMASAVLVSYQVLTVIKRKLDQWRHNYDPALGRPSSNSTTAITFDDTSTAGTIFKNGSNRLKTNTKNIKDTTELQLMMPANKSDKEVTFKT